MKRFSVHAFADETDAAARFSVALHAPLQLIQLHAFPDGESLPLVGPPASTAIIYRSLDHPDPKIVPLLLAADALRRAGASRLVLVAPYLCYLRQDAVFSPGQPLSRDVVGPLLGGAFDLIVTVQAHLHRTANLSEVLRGAKALNLSAMGLMAQAFADGEPPLFVAPDEESVAWAREAAATLRTNVLTFRKHRLSDRAVTLESDQLAMATGRRVVVLDDVCSSGGTLVETLRRLALFRPGRMEVGVVHALFGEAVERRLIEAGAARIVSADSVGHATNRVHLGAPIAEALTTELADLR